MPKKTERGDPFRFFNIHSVGKYQKIEGGPFGEFFFEKRSHSRKYSKGVPFGPVEFLEKSLAMPKKTERETLWSRRYCILHGKPFWFGSLGQQVQFDVFIKFGRTILVTSGVSKKNNDEKPSL